MKRPLFLLCIVLTVILVYIENAGNSIMDSPAFYGESLLLQEAEQKKRITIKGCIVSCDAVSEGKRLSLAQLSIPDKGNSEFVFLSKLKLNITIDQTELKPGDTIVVSGEYTTYDSARNPGGFDAKTYYHRENVIGSLRNPKIHFVQSGNMSIKRILYIVRERLRISCEAILDERKGKTLTAICLGEKSNMEQEWKTVYQEGGISHILAVSGLHITLIGMSVFKLLRILHVSYIGAAILSGTISCFYVMMAGISISALRAFLMFLLWLGAQTAGRKYDRMTAVAVTALVLVCLDGSSIQTASFVLSFAAVASIAILLPCVLSTCEIKGKIPEGIAGSCCIFAGTFPFTLMFFYQFSPWSILVNLPVVALMPYVMGMGLLSSVIGILKQSAGVFMATSVAWLLELFDLLCFLQIRIPHAVWIAGAPKPQAAAGYYFLLMTGIFLTECWKHKKKSKWISRILWILLFMVCIVWIIPDTEKELMITCLDVGQGDCSLLQFPDGTNCMIDAGSSSKRNVWKYQISDSVKYYGMETLDYVFLSHADSDHTNGIREFLQTYEPGLDGRNIHGLTIRNLVLPPVSDPEDFKEIKQLAANCRIKVFRMEKGDAVSDNTWSITCLAPDDRELSGDQNEDSMVLMVEYQKFRMLFTGDLEGEAEQKLVENVMKQQKDKSMLRADVLKAGHHGSANATSETLLEAVMPQIAVLSYGENNIYGHPAEDTTERLRKYGVRMYETAVNGAIMILSDGHGFSCSGYVP